MPARREDGESGNLARARFEGWAGLLFSLSTKTERDSLMDHLAPASAAPLRVMHHESSRGFHPTLVQPTVLVATVDSDIASSMRELLQLFPLKTIWAKGVDEVRAVLAKESVAALRIDLQISRRIILSRSVLGGPATSHP
jgi:hypothetical protein